LGKPLTILGNMHVCPKVDPGPRPHIGGPIVDAGQKHVKFNNIPIAVEGGKCLCTGVPCSDGLTKGSSHVRINGKGIMRIGDSTAHGGKLVTGVPNIRVS